MAIEEMAAPPRLGRLYRAAALGGLRRRRPDHLPATELLVPEVGIDRAHLAEYDRVCGFRLSDALPATYPHVLAFPLALELLARPEFPLPLLGMVHVANRVEALGPLRAQDRFEIRVRAADLRPHNRGRQVDLLAEARVAGECVWRSRSTFLHREAGDRPAGPRPASTREEGAGRDGEPPAGRVPIAVLRIPADVGARYAAVSGDRNPIHTSRLAARLFGFARPIAHGMWSKARCLAALEGRLPSTYAVDVAFKAPILLPARAALTAARPADDATGWRFGLHDARTGRPHVTGELQTLA
jgi:acyl dehydratase